MDEADFKEWEDHHGWKVSTSHQFCDECYPFAERKTMYL